MVQKEGSRALWRGLLPTMLRDVPFSGIYWMGYEKIKHNLEQRQDLTHFQTSFIAGASSGMVSLDNCMGNNMLKSVLDCSYHYNSL